MKEGEQPPLPEIVRRPGRPRKLDAITPAQAQAAYRARRRRKGEQDIHVWLPKEIVRDLRREAKRTGQLLEEVASNAIIRGVQGEGMVKPRRKGLTAAQMIVEDRTR